ncbi:MAG: SagB/ThcOx family dehydrogenase [candidate division Zixibacteria bacterium]|nr:SagB/ThcOx family dehydrogenase [candidate division Zixibacteria bacterium]
MFVSGSLTFFLTQHGVQPLADEETQAKGETMKLPKPRLKGPTSVEEALLSRRSLRDYGKDSLNVEQISQVLWAAQGITEKWGGRTAPSAGALYPLEIHLLAGEVKGLDPGLYHYNPEDHSISQIKVSDLRKTVTQASLGQDEIQRAPATFIISAVYERTMVKYGERGVRYVHMEVGSVAENIYLQAESLGLGTVFIGAFDDEEVKKALGIEEEPLAIMPVGKK